MHFAVAPANAAVALLGNALANLVGPYALIEVFASASRTSTRKFGALMALRVTEG